MNLMRSVDNWINNQTGIVAVSKVLAGQIRAQQISSTTNLTPLMMLGNTMLMLGVLIIGSKMATPVPIYIWCAGLTMLIFFSLKSWSYYKNISKPYASIRAAHSIVRNALVLGTYWGMLPVLMFFGGGVEETTIVAIAISGMICGGGFALAAIPQAVFVFIAPMLFTSTLMLALSGTLIEILSIAVLWTYTAIVVMASLNHGKIFVERIVSRTDAEERSQTIALLLKDFEKKSSDWLWNTDSSGKFIDVSERFASAARSDTTQLLQTKFLELFSKQIARRRSNFKKLIEMLRQKSSFRNIELPIMIEDDLHWWSVTGQAKYDQAGIFAGYNGVAADITERKIAEQRSEYLSENDELTGLINRRKFVELLDGNVENIEDDGEKFSVFYLDLDQFKTVNDTKGHEVGDRLLVKVANRIRKTAKPHDIISRLGGDEFAIIALSAPTKAKANELAEELLRSITKPYFIDDEILNVGLSIGITVAPDDGSNAKILLRNADLALYRSKSDGKRNYRFFKSDMDEIVQMRRQLEFDLSNALEMGELELMFQPLVCIEDGYTKGFEALIRWNHPINGRISPDVFIPVAERSGLIHDIGNWVLQEACRVASQWPASVSISVNLSPVQFEDDDIVNSVKSALTNSNIDPVRLELEITENLLLSQQQNLLKTLRNLKKLGVSIAMDDFGTGYSSLSYLTIFPFDRIKIDRAFVSTIDEDETARAILTSIGDLGKSLNMEITAEGVENYAQIEFLRTISCDLLQGYYFSKPMSEAETAVYLVKSLPTPLPDMKLEPTVQWEKQVPQMVCNE